MSTSMPNSTIGTSTTTAQPTTTTKLFQTDVYNSAMAWQGLWKTNQQMEEEKWIIFSLVLFNCVSALENFN